MTEGLLLPATPILVGFNRWSALNVIYLNGLGVAWHGGSYFIPHFLDLNFGYDCYNGLCLTCDSIRLLRSTVSVWLVRGEEARTRRDM
jgi:hypothetical protein